MAHNKVVIDVEARFIDNVTGKAARADKAVDNLGKKKPKVVVTADTSDADGKVDKTGKKLDELGKKKPKPAVDVEDNATKKIQGILDKAQSLANKVYDVAVKIRDNDTLNELSKIEQKAKSIAGKAWTAVVKVKDLATAPLKALYNSIFNIKTLIAGVLTGLAAKQFIMNPINLADQYSSAKIGFSTLLGEDRGKQMMNEIDAFAKATPFKTSGVISNVQKMMAYGWDVDKVIEDMKTIGDAAAATGKGDQGLESIVYALSEIRSKGKLSTQELNQLASAGIKAKAYLAQGLGYGTSDEGMAALAKDLEKGAIGANQAIDLILEGMKEFNGMMDKTANETVEGLKSQLEDTFEINIARRWGQGLQDGAKRGLGSVVKLLDDADSALMAFGDTVYEVGKELSNYFANVLDDTVKRIKDIVGSKEFKEASLPKKIGMLWKGAIANPFADWWSTTVVPWWDQTAVPWLAEKAGKLGKTIGTGLSNGLLTLLGVDVGGAAADGADIATSFVQGFLDGFDGGAIAEAIADAIGNAWNALPMWAKVLVGGYGVSKGAGMITSIAGGAATLAGGASKFFGGAAAGTGLLGIGSTAAINMGAGNLAGGASLGAGALSALGLGAIAGGAVGVGTLASGAYDLYKGYKNKDQVSKDTGASKLGGVAGGALAGAALGSAIPVIGTLAGGLIGAGAGGLLGWLRSKEIKKEAAESIESMKELESQSDKNEQAADVLKQKNEALANSLGDVSLSYAEVREMASKIFDGKMTKKMTSYATATAEADAAMADFASSAENVNKLNWKASLGFKFSKDEKATYKQAVKNYIESAEKALESEHYEFTAAVKMLVDPKSDEGKSIIKGGDAFYAKLQEEIDKTEKTLNKKVKIALKDGEIDADEAAIIEDLQNKIAEITNKVAGAQNEAKMEQLKIKFGAGAIDSASFEQLQRELVNQIESSTLQYDDALTASITSLKLQLDEGAIDQATYDEQIKSLTEGYNANIGEIHANATKVQLDILGDAFSDVLGEDAKEKLSSALSQSLADGITPMNWTQEQAQQYLNTESLTEQMATGIGTALQTVTETADMDLAGISVSGGGALTDNVKTEVASAVASAVAMPFTANATISITPTITGLSGLGSKIGNAVKNATTGGKRGGLFYPSGRNVPKLGSGGQVSGGAQLAVLAEEGTPEMVIPLGSQRRKRGLALWEQAGHMMGVPGFASGGLVGGKEDAGIRFHDNSGAGAAGGSGGVQVSVGGVTVEVNVNGGGDNPNIAAAIKEQGQEIADTVAGILADAFKGQFENTPTKGVA